MSHVPACRRKRRAPFAGEPPLRNPACKKPRALAPHQHHPSSPSPPRPWGCVGGKGGSSSPPSSTSSLPPSLVCFSFLPLKISCNDEPGLLGNAGAAPLGLVPCLLAGARSDALLRQQTLSQPKCSCGVTRQHPHNPLTEQKVSFLQLPSPALLLLPQIKPRMRPCAPLGSATQSQAPTEPEPLLSAVDMSAPGHAHHAGTKTFGFHFKHSRPPGWGQASLAGGSSGVVLPPWDPECWPDPTTFPASFILNEEPYTASKSLAPRSDGQSPLLVLFIAGLRKSASKSNWTGER